MRNKTGVRLRKLHAIWLAGGTTYSALFVLHWAIHRLGAIQKARLQRLPPARAVIDRLRKLLGRTDTALVAVERERRIVEPWSITSRRFSIAENREWWNRHDWSSLGEEWTPNAQWKTALIEGFLVPYIPDGGTVVEIGPGGGRWTEILAERCGRLYVVDVAERALELCRARFRGRTNIHFLLTGEPRIDVAAEIADAIWSYDVFVHVNADDTRRYFQEFRRVLKPGGTVIIHHPGPAPRGGERRPGTRSELTDQLVSAFAQENGFEIIDQSREFVNPGDVLSVLRKVGRTRAPV